MNRHYWALCAALLFAPLFPLATSAGQGQPHEHQEKAGKAEEPGKSGKGRAPEALPSIPQPDPRAAQVPPGYRVEVILARLTYPTSIEFDDAGTVFVAEGGYIYGDDVAPARILRVTASGNRETVAEDLNGPITDLLWHDKRLYISHRGKISVLESSGVRDLVTGLPSLGDHHNNQLAVGPDGKIYFGQGTATNSGVVGLDNFKGGWLAKYPEVCDVPAKDIRLSDQAFEAPDPLTLLADKRKEHGEKAQGSKSGTGHEGHAEHEPQGETNEHAGHESGQKSATSHEGQGAQKPTGEGQEHAGHELSQKPGKAPAPASGGKTEPADEHAGHAKGKSSAKAVTRTNGNEPEKGEKESTEAEKGNDHKGHAAPGKDAQREKESEHEGRGESPMGTAQPVGQGHEGHGAAKSSARGAESEGHMMVKSFAFQPFAKTPPDDGAVRGTTKASGTILRMNPDGSDLEMYAWGLRNPFGLTWGPDGNLYSSDNGYDERGSRPIAHAPDCLWAIKQDAWYGFPDFAGGIPVTDTQFAPEHGPAPKFLMRDHPNVEKPLLSLTHHVGAAKIDFSRGDGFGFAGHLFLALSGDMNPITGTHEERSGFEVMHIDPESGEAETFFKAKKDALGPRGMEYVVTAGPRRPVDVRFSPDGGSLYVVDVGAMAIISTATGPAPRPFPGTGIVWRITRDDSNRAAQLPARPERSLR